MPTPRRKPTIASIWLGIAGAIAFACSRGLDVGIIAAIIIVPLGVLQSLRLARVSVVDDPSEQP